MYETESSRWRAVQSRDESAASAFIYAVTTTKIFCRPSCPSRLARRANICFYDSVADAVKAGYRPCLRCKPDQAMASHLDNKAARQKAVDEACRYIEKSKTHVKFSDVAKHVNLSTRYLHGLFKEVMGITPAKYVELYKTCQRLDSESSASPVSFDASGNFDIDPIVHSTDSTTVNYTMAPDSESYYLPITGDVMQHGLQTSAGINENTLAISAGLVNSRFPPNDFDLIFDESLTETLFLALPDQV